MIRKDVISHFALRLAYRSPDRHRWLIDAETRLFSLRLDNAYWQDFLEDNNECEIERHSANEEDESVRQFFSGPDRSTDLMVYSVPFTQVLDLVRSRRAIIKRGIAICKYDIEKHREHVCRMFRRLLEEKLVRAHAVFGLLNSDYKEQLDEFLDSLPSQYLGKEFVASDHEQAEVSLHNLPRLAQRDFPLCMKQQYEHILTTHHMPHTGRLQFGLFLKGIGLTIDQSLQWWHDEFVQSAGEDGWKKKNYAYNIRYNYGEVGRRQNWHPYNCHKIISSSADRSDPHGCPFRNRSNEHIFQELRGFITDPKLHHAATKSVGAALGEKNYAQACIEFFRAKHGEAAGPDLEASSMHPNLYFLRSYAESEKNPDEKAADWARYEATRPYAAALPTTAPAEADWSHYNEDDGEYDDIDLSITKKDVTAKDGESSSQPKTAQMELDELLPSSEGVAEAASQEETKPVTAAMEIDEASA